MKFQNVKVGDKLWSTHLGDCKVTKPHPDATDYRIHCVNEEGRVHSYTLDGLYFNTDQLPSLFFSKPEIIEPKRKVTKTEEVWIAFDPLGTIAATNANGMIKEFGYLTKGTLTYEIEE